MQHFSSYSNSKRTPPTHTIYCSKVYPILYFLSLLSLSSYRLTDWLHFKGLFIYFAFSVFPQNPKVGKKFEIGIEKLKRLFSLHSPNSSFLSSSASKGIEQPNWPAGRPVWSQETRIRFSPPLSLPSSGGLYRYAAATTVYTYIKKSNLV